MYSRILVPIDGSEPAECGLRQAIAMAGTGAGGATLVVLHVVTQLPLLMGAAGYVNYGEMSEILARTGHELVEKAAKQAAEAGVACETVVVDGGMSPACDTIVEQAGRQRCDLIAMGTHGRRGLRRLTLGSDAELVVRLAGVPVLLAKPPVAKA